VFHHSLPKYLSRDIEQIQKRALSIAHPGLKYEDALTESELLTLEERRKIACEKFLNQIVENPKNQLSNFISKIDLPSSYDLRNNKSFNIPKFRTERFKKSFLIASSINANKR
jgi:hypothetical protein